MDHHISDGVVGAAWEETGVEEDELSWIGMPAEVGESPRYAIRPRVDAQGIDGADEGVVGVGNVPL